MTNLFAVASGAIDAVLVELDRLGAGEPPDTKAAKLAYQAEQLQIHLHLVVQAWLSTRPDSPVLQIGDVLDVVSSAMGAAAVGFVYDLCAVQGMADGHSAVVVRVAQTFVEATELRLAAMKSDTCEKSGVYVQMTGGALQAYTPDFRDRLTGVRRG